jgi:hypothetical protein
MTGVGVVDLDLQNLAGRTASHPDQDSFVAQAAVMKWAKKTPNKMGAELSYLEEIVLG